MNSAIGEANQGGKQRGGEGIVVCIHDRRSTHAEEVLGNFSKTLKTEVSMLHHIL